MQLKASVTSKAFKRNSADKIAASLGKEPSLSHMVGRLECNATTAADFETLRILYDVLIGPTHGGGGSIHFFDAKGIKLAEYSNLPPRINLNGKEISTPKTSLSYYDIVELAGYKDGMKPDVIYTVTHHGGGLEGGSLTPGTAIAVRNGMVFNAVNTGNA